MLREQRSWSEQYLVQALLMYSPAFRILFAAYRAHSVWPDLLDSAMAVPGNRSLLGGSLWLERRPALG